MNKDFNGLKFRQGLYVYTHTRSDYTTAVIDATSCNGYSIKGKLVDFDRSIYTGFAKIGRIVRLTMSALSRREELFICKNENAVADWGDTYPNFVNQMERMIGVPLRRIFHDNKDRIVPISKFEMETCDINANICVCTDSDFDQCCWAYEWNSNWVELTAPPEITITNIFEFNFK